MADKEEEIPDELPSLAEDILKEGDDAKEEKAEPAADDVPDELPSLDEEEAPPEELPAEPTAAPAEEPAPPAATPAEEPAPIEVDDETYFGGLMAKLKKNPRLSGDFLDEMKTYWKGHGGDKEEMVVKDGLKTSFELDLEKEMQEKVRQLKELEANWKKQKLELERSKKLVENTEIEIQLRSEELKKILDTLTELKEVYHDIRTKLKARGPPKKKASHHKPHHKPKPKKKKR